jgi:rhodanese-related sulfurtransferase
VDEQEVVQAPIGDVPSALDESVVLLDVREDDEWQRGHAPGARHIPMGQIPSRLAELDPNAMLFVGVRRRRALATGRAVLGPQRLYAAQRRRRDASLGGRGASGDHR